MLVEVALFTDRVEETTRFYEGMLGRAADSEVPGMAEFHLGQVVLRVHGRHPEEPGGPPSADHVAFRAEDVAAETARLAVAGLSPVSGPARFPWGTSVYFRDPDGRVVELAQS